MNRIPVISSNIVSIGYDPATATMEIEFASGAVYQYFDVPQPVYEQLVGSASIGTTLNELVKGQYRYARVQ
ncbi:MAG TPA: KTSC domain-containing protein [Nitrospira sp.]|nr:KTSC domain-containing protein [Nitrospira sp.]